MWFIEVSSERVKGQWKHRTAGTEIRTGRQAVTGGRFCSARGTDGPCCGPRGRAKHTHTDSYGAVKGVWSGLRSGRRKAL